MAKRDQNGSVAAWISSFQDCILRCGVRSWRYWTKRGNQSPPVRKFLSRVSCDFDQRFSLNPTMSLLQYVRHCQFCRGKLFSKTHLLILRGNILAARSSVFEKMFYGSLPENGAVVRIPDTKPDAFRLMLKYCRLLFSIQMKILL